MDYRQNFFTNGVCYVPIIPTFELETRQDKSVISLRYRLAGCASSFYFSVIICVIKCVKCQPKVRFFGRYSVFTKNNRVFGTTYRVTTKECYVVDFNDLYMSKADIMGT